MTTYDEIYIHFVTINKTDPVNMPVHEQVFHSIHSAVLHFNNRLRDTLRYDDDTETVNRQLSDDEILIMAYLLKLSFLENELTYFTTLWQPFAKDVGLKNYQAQVKGLEALRDTTEARVTSLINNTQTDYL